jgi:peptidylprolyl isomerase
MQKDFTLKFVVLAILAIFVVLFLLRANNNGKAIKQNRQLGQAFLDKNSQKEDVITTDSGLQYMVLEDVVEGAGDTPSPTSTVTVHYHGTLLNGLVFDSSVERGRPAQFPLGQVIAGWTEGLQYMHVGEKFRFFIPSQLAYGDRSVASIPAGSTLIFDVELLSIDNP